MKPKARRLLRIYMGYTFSFFIPCILVCSILYIHAVGKLRSEIEHWNIDKLEQVRQSTDMQMQELSILASKISHDPRLTPYMLGNNYHQLESINELHRYKSSNSMIEDVMIYIRGENYVYSSYGITDYERVIDRLYHRSHDTITKVMMESDKKAIIPAIPMDIYTGQEVNIVTYAYPLPYPNSSPYGVALILIKQSQLLNMIDNILGTFEGGAAILDEQGRVLAAKISGNTLTEAMLIALSDSDISSMNTDGTVGSMDINQTAYSVSRLQSLNTGWSFVTAMEASQFYKTVSYLQMLIAVAVSVPLLGGLVFIIWILMNKYRPVVQLVHDIKTRFSDNQEWTSEKGNEIEFLHRSFQDTYERNQSLKQTIDVQKHAMQEKLIFDIIHGKFTNEQELRHELELNQIELTGSHYFLAVILRSSGQDGEDDTPARAMPHTFYRVSSEQWDVYELDLWKEDVTCWLFSIRSDVPVNTDMRKRVLDKYLKDTYPDVNEVYMFCGGVYPLLSNANRSFIEAMAAREYRSFYPTRRCLFFEEVAEQSEKVEWFSHDKLLRFHHAVKQGDVTVAIDALQAMFALLYQKQSMLMLKFVLSDMVNQLVKAMSRPLIDQHLDEIQQWAKMIDLIELQNRMIATVQEVCASVERQREADQSELADNLLEEIHLKYNSYDLSLESLADELEMSPSSLSKYFKKHFGTSFSDYIFGLRLEYVKQELVHTDKAVKDIITEAGYLAVSSFIDRFKKREGVTPGDYRRMHQI